MNERIPKVLVVLGFAATVVGVGLYASAGASSAVSFGYGCGNGKYRRRDLVAHAPKDQRLTPGYRTLPPGSATSPRSFPPSYPVVCKYEGMGVSESSQRITPNAQRPTHHAQRTSTLCETRRPYPLSASTRAATPSRSARPRPCRRRRGWRCGRRAGGRWREGHGRW